MLSSEVCLFEVEPVPLILLALLIPCTGILLFLAVVYVYRVRSISFSGFLWGDLPSLSSFLAPAAQGPLPWSGSGEVGLRIWWKQGVGVGGQGFVCCCVCAGVRMVGWEGHADPSLISNLNTLCHPKSTQSIDPPRKRRSSQLQRRGIVQGGWFGLTNAGGWWHEAHYFLFGLGLGVTEGRI